MMGEAHDLQAVNALFYFMWNVWNAEVKPQDIFGKVMGDHFESKWNAAYERMHGPRGAFEILWAEMSNNYREILLEKAMEYYNIKKLD